MEDGEGTGGGGYHQIGFALIFFSKKISSSVAVHISFSNILAKVWSGSLSMVTR